MNEKVEGFFDTCVTLGLDGEQGVIVPAANVGDLMLRHDAVEACASSRFGVYCVENIQDAIELLSGSRRVSPMNAASIPKIPCCSCPSSARARARRRPQNCAAPIIGASMKKILV